MADAATPLHAKEQERTLYTYKLPKSLQGKCEHVKKSVGMVKLTAEDHSDAVDRAAGNTGKMVSEVAKASLARVDGKPLDMAEGEDRLVWNRMDPKIRDLIMAAYSALNNADEEEKKDFLSSMAMEV